VWSPDARGSALRAIALTAQTIKTYADWLANFLEWTEVRAVDLASCDYVTDIVGGYQRDMLDGTWSRDGNSLSPPTVNDRVQQACDFLSWMAEKGHRGPFDVLHDLRSFSIGSATSSHGRRYKEVKVRKARVPEPKQLMHMPADKDVWAWHARVKRHFGTTYALMCETVLRTALRLSEVTGLRLDTLPASRDQWRVLNPDAPRRKQCVLVSVRYGTKGPSYGEDSSDKIGPERWIRMPLDLADRWDDYRKQVRPHALLKHVRQARTAQEQQRRRQASVHLFLDDERGTRVTGRQLYRAWVGVEPPTGTGWSPHRGRDWWACATLLLEMARHEHLARSGLATATALLESTAMSIIRLQIQPQLGHSHDSTTMIYLQWVLNMVGSGLPQKYEQDLELQETANA